MLNILIIVAVGLMAALVGHALVQLFLGTLELGSKFGRLVDRTPSYAIIAASFGIAALMFGPLILLALLPR